MTDESRREQLEGFVPFLAVIEQNSVFGALRNPADIRLIKRVTSDESLFESTAVRAAGAVAAVAVGVSLKQWAPSLVVIYFDDENAASRQWESLLEVRDHDRIRIGEVTEQIPELESDAKIGHELLSVQTQLLHASQTRHFAFMEQFLARYYETMGEPALSGQRNAVDTLLHQCVLDLAKQLHCPDVRIYLVEDSPDAHETDDLNLESSDGLDRRFLLKWASWAEAPDAFVRLDDPGPAGWAIRTGQKIYMHNVDLLRKFPRQFEAVYPGLRQLDSVGWSTDGRSINLLHEAGRAPGTISYIDPLLIYPIAVGGHPVGALVCNGRSCSPYVFHEWDSTSLGLIALAIGGTWLGFVNRRRSELDAAMVTRAVIEINNFGTKINGWMTLAREVQDDEIYEAALNAADQIVGRRAFSSIRGFDPAKRIMEFKYFGGDIWDEQNLKQRAKTASFRVDEDQPTTAASYVFRNRQPLLVNILRVPKHFKNSFPEATRIGLYLPILHGGRLEEPIGLLDVRSVTSEPLPPSAVGILQILAQMIGLAVALLHGQEDLLRETRQLQSEREKQLLILEDMAHQVTTPQRNALQQLATVSKYLGPSQISAGPNAKAAQLAVAIARGHMRRAIRVGLTSRLFQELRETGRITRSRNAGTIRKEKLVKMVLEILEDQRLLLEKDKNVQFLCNTHSFNDFYGDDIVCEQSHLEQILTNLVENAAKYSFVPSIVRVTAMLSRSRDRFIIQIENDGFDIQPNEVRRIVQRGVRGQEAEYREPSGQGIGLFLVERIMDSLGGQLEIIPSKKRGDPHQFRLLFEKHLGQRSGS